MKDHLAYAIGKYAQAYYSLATEPCDIRKRLFVAWGYLIAISPDMVPDEICADVKWIYDQFTRKDTVEKSLRGLHVKSLVKIAKEIIRIYCKMEQIFSPNCSQNTPLGYQPVNINIDLGNSD
jgi:hypothetical protein